MSAEKPDNSPIVVLAALWDELLPLVRRLRLARHGDHFEGEAAGRRVAAYVTGMGADAVSAGARRAIERHQPAHMSRDTTLDDSRCALPADT